VTLPRAVLSLWRRLALPHKPVSHNWAVESIRLGRVCAPEPYAYDRPQPKPTPKTPKTAGEQPTYDSSPEDRAVLFSAPWS
jgi:hypothetical protein